MRKFIFYAKLSYTTQRIYDLAYYVLIGSLIVSALCTALSFWAGNRISNDLTLRLAGAVKTAGEADERASRANERAALLEKDAAAAHAEATQNAERTAVLEKSSEQLRADNIEQQRQLERERISRIELQNALATPHLTLEKIDHLADALRGRISEVNLQFTSQADSLILSQDIYNTLLKAGVHVLKSSAGVMVPTPYGLIITIPDESFSFLIEAFKNVGLIPRVHVQAGPRATILVGLKPPPF
jgi:hypothetical protein